MSWKFLFLLRFPYYSINSFLSFESQLVLIAQNAELVVFLPQENSW